MKRFDFSLQKLLDLREFYEDQSEMGLARAIAEREKIVLELHSVAESRARATGERSVTQSVFDLISIENYIHRLDIKKEELLEAMAEAELLIEKRRKEMEEAIKNRKVLTRLHDKQNSDYRKKMQQAEDVSMDDIIGPAYKAD